MGGVASCSHCVQDDKHMMWSMLTSNEVACTCLHMYSSGDVGTFKGMLCVGARLVCLSLRLLHSLTFEVDLTSTVCSCMSL